MSEFGQLLGRILHRKATATRQPSPELKPRVFRPINPAAEPDLARLYEIWLTPGVLNGTFPFQRTGGVEVIDFDYRDNLNRPARRFYPGADISDFEVK